MEALRRKLMSDPTLYPELSPNSSPPTSVASAISISSTSSASDSPSGSSLPIRTKKAAVKHGVVVSESSDEETDQEPVRFVKSHGPTVNPAPSQMTGSKVNPPYLVPDTLSGAPPFPIPQPSYDRFQASSSTDPDDIEVLPMPELPYERANFTPTEADKALRDLMSGSMNEDENLEVNEEDAVVEGFREGVRLLEHQVIGRHWMKEREDPATKRHGGILADDMGLGKTIQTLTRIVDNRPRKSDRADWDPPTLIVCPLALVEQWASEINKMIEGFIVIKHQGTSRTLDPAKLKRSHVVITTYDTVRSEYATFSPDIKNEGKKKSKSDGSDSDESSDGPRPIKKKAASRKDALFRVRWWRIVLDEAHNIKNRNAKSSVACCELKAKYRWCLTGTPMQNEVLELYSLIKFLRIKPLSEFHTFNEQIAKPVKSGKGAARAMKRLQIVLKTIMLRRTKTQTLNGKPLVELPPRNVETLSCPFDDSEKIFYSTLEERMSSVVKNLASKEKASYIGALVLLLRLRQACDHPALVSKDFKNDMEAINPQTAASNSQGGSQDPDDLAEAFGTLNVSRNCLLCTDPLTEKNTDSGSDKHCLTCSKLRKNAASHGSQSSSAKIRMTLKLLRDTEERDPEEKTIIFSQFTSMLDLLEPFLRDEAVRYVRYDGSMQTPERESALRAIKSNADIKVILVSFKAGSTGLNLTACNNVILVDLWWNPALEDQAFDRAHRYGQTRPVNIYKLKIDDTVEDRILALQEKKRELARAALSGERVKNMKLGMDELLALFRPGGRDDDEED